jgi:hypothetical protein
MSEPLKWTKCRWEDEPTTRPTLPGHYVVVIEGENNFPEYVYPRYETFARLEPLDQDGEQRMKVLHDEEPEWILAWYGPIELPSCDCL